MFYGTAVKKTDYRSGRQKTGDLILGNRIRKIREGLGLSQREAAEIAGLGREIWCHYENGNRNMPTENRPGVALALQVTIGQLMGTEKIEMKKQEPEKAPEPEEPKPEVEDAIIAEMIENPDIEITLEDIDPDTAQKYLDTRKKHNRSTPGSTVDMYARALKAGKWQLTSETIKFSPSGELFDGQHRMMAVVKAKVPMKTYVARNVKDNCILVVDTGRKRSTGDILAIRGQKNAYALASAARKLVWFALDDFHSVKVSDSEVSMLLDVHPLLSKSVTFCNACRAIPASSLAAIHYIGTVYQGKGELAEQFARTLITGEHASPTDPAWVLRERSSRMIEDRAAKSRWNREDRDRTAVYAWMRYMNGKQMERIVTQSTMDLPGWTPSVCFGGEAPEFTLRSKEKQT